MGDRPETPRARAKREGKAYVKLVIDTRYSEPNGTLIELEGPHELEHLAAARKCLRDLTRKSDAE